MAAQYRDGKNKYSPNQYVERKDLDCFACDIGCLCKFVDPRSTFDKMQQETLVCGDKTINLPVVPDVPATPYPCRSAPYLRG